MNNLFSIQSKRKEHSVLFCAILFNEIFGDKKNGCNTGLEQRSGVRSDKYMSFSENS